ncbi:MAG TPA: Fe-S cluster assembly protein SufD [Opitutaceae bacterium]|nr:Fe-S cluster assembly protein SufD [Opitutaceae bacterium]HND62152.1 Fe-S cluster assembly protein SufD [Opitutaceae bacterium]
MSAPVLTPASLTGAFTPEAFAAHLATVAHLPAWWLDRKRAAYERFTAAPMPKRTDESWRFATLTGLQLDGYVRGGAAPLAQLGHAPVGIAKAGRIVLANNRLVSVDAVAADLAARGVIFDTLQNALLRHGDLVKSHLLAQPAPQGSEKLAALHTAFLEDGAFLYVPRNVEVAGPLAVFHYAHGANSAVFPHTLVVAEAGARVTLVDLFRSTDGSRQFACGQNDLFASHGADVTYVAAQTWSRETLSFQFNSTIARRDARVLSLNLHLGGRQARHESHSQLQAPGAHTEMLALTVARGTQEFDQRTLQIHQAPHTSSNLLYKNALLERSKTIFSGLIVVDADAQKTDAYQSNRNLLLSDEAEANSLPGLEIQANDVRCTHGATSSPIDPEQEFYLQARGIRKSEADELLTFGFFEEVLNKLTNDQLHDALRELIKSSFAK